MLKYIRLIFTTGIRFAWDCSFYKRKLKKEGEKLTCTKRYESVNKLMTTANRVGFHAEFFIKGQEKLPKGQVLFVSNHQSALDPVCMLMISDRPIAFLAKKEVKKMPYIPFVLESIKGSYIDRMDLRSEIKVFKEINETLEQNPDTSFFVYPEGTRTKDKYFALGPFHGGSFKIATRRDIPICPVAIYLTARILDQHYHYHRYPVQVSFLDPIMPEKYQSMTTQEIADLVRDRIIAEVDKMKERDLELVKMVNKYSDKKARKVQYLPRKEYQD